jgi:hypothetical protein
VRDQEAEHLGELWSDGAKDYVRYVDELLREYKEVVDAEIGARQRRQGGARSLAERQRQRPAAGGVCGPSRRTR